MADEYIRLDTTIIGLDGLINEAPTGSQARALLIAKDMIYDQQRYIADVHPVKRGHWESGQYLWETGQTRCSNCMAEFYADDLMCIAGDDKNIPDFCPCCGADMRGENDG